MARQGGREPEQRFVVPPITYPAELPVSAAPGRDRRGDPDHQVVVVAGETGSGKTTQLPKICLELGRGVPGLIGHTQPRRLAARTVAERIAEELGTPLGDPVGYQVRFTDQVSDRNAGQADDRRHPAGRDRSATGTLRRYDTLIIDEAHERSLNIDFLLGYLRAAAAPPSRPEGDHHLGDDRPRRFARHFVTRAAGPVVEVSGRTYPVEIRYRPLALPTDAPGAGARQPGRRRPPSTTSRSHATRSRASATRSPS